MPDGARLFFRRNTDMRFKANRGGHAPGHLREWFERWVAADRTIDPKLREGVGDYITGHRFPLRRKSLCAWVLGQLWDCRDQMPSTMRAEVQTILGEDHERHFTYAAAARALKSHLPDAVASAPGAGQRRRMGDYVTVIEARDRATAARRP